MILIKNKFGSHVTITSALPYVNGVKHLGNLAGSLLPADIFHRFLDMFGVPNIYICGTDDHGTAVELAALKEKISIPEYCKKYYDIQKQIYRRWNFDFTFFGNTSSETNHKTSKHIFLALNENNLILEQSLTIPYCKKCRRFLPDRYITGTCPECGYEHARGDQCEKCGKVLEPCELKNPHCYICNSDNLEFRQEPHLFVDFPKLEKQLEVWIKANKQWPSAVRNFALGWIKHGLKPRCITRNLENGIKVPLKNYEHLVFYCWFDAPIGYISITEDAEKAGRITNWKKWWLESENPKIYHFLGKDNVPFHTIFWPGFLIGSDLGYALPYFIRGYEYLNWCGSKFSTSKNIGLFSDKALDLFPADYWRFYLARILPETKDSNFSWADFKTKINSELIANYGNLFYRVTNFIEKHFNGFLPAPHKFGKSEKKLEDMLHKSINRIEDAVHKVRLREALEEIMLLSSATNKYFQHSKPWDKSAKKQDIEKTLFVSANILRIISLLLYPYIPETSLKALQLLGSPLPKSKEQWKTIRSFTLKRNCKIKSKILFKKIEDADIEKTKIMK